VQRDRLQSAENYRQTEGIKGRLHSHGTHAQRYDTHAVTDWGRLITKLSKGVILIEWKFEIITVEMHNIA